MRLIRLSRAFFSRFSANTGKFIFQNLEFRQEILDFMKDSLYFQGEILRKPLSLAALGVSWCHWNRHCELYYCMDDELTHPCRL